MKRILYIIFFFAVLLLTNCQKKPQLKIYKLEITEEIVAVTPYSATITANYSYPGAIPQIMVYASTNSSMSNAIETDAVLDENTMTAVINNLASDTKYYYRLRYSNGMKLVDTEIKDFTTEHAIVVPTLTTIPAASITSNSAVSGGNISEDGGSEITARGVCWNKESNPTIENEHTTNGAAIGGFISNITNLEANTIYYVKAYATNAEGTGYGNEITFITSASLATISTKAITNITENSAKCGGNITNSGGMDITARGVCWSIEHNPTISDAHTTDGNGIGEFESEITGLNANITYYVRAYAISSYGTSYGEEREFKTVVGMASVTTNSITGITASSAVGGGNVESDGGDNITARGVCWATTQNPTISNNHTTDGTGSGEFVSSITGLTNNVTYYVRAYATNSNGTAYGEERSFTTQEGLAVVTTTDITNITATTATSGGGITDDGGFIITARGVCWSTSQNPTTGDAHTSNGTGTGTFVSNLAGLTYNTTYYVRAYATNSKGTSYGEEKIFTTNKLAPTVSTTEVTSINSNSAVTGGNVTSDGGANVTARGVCYGTLQNPTISGQHTSDGNGTGTFTSTLTGLTANTIYYVRAYATNSEGTSYGTQKTFTTQQTVTLPTVTTNNVTGITQTTAVSGGNVTSTGNGTVSAKGVCWSTGQNPSINNSHSTDGTGSGSYTSSLTSLYPNTTYYVRAYATNEAGTAYGSQKVFTTEGGSPSPPTWTNGILPGLFSISSSEQVHFSQGNLQYQASTNTWRFADHQYDYVGDDNTNISAIYSGWIDLFGWGTSGYNHGAVCYQPWSTSQTNNDYYAYGNASYNLCDQTCQADWGYNAISNGGVSENLWRTLSNAEWSYICNTRNTNSGVRYAKAQVNGIKGIILLPDDWSISTYSLNNTNMSGADFLDNTISQFDWINSFECNGAVFLPSSGYRNATSFISYGAIGDCYGGYWSSDSYGNNMALCMHYDRAGLAASGYFPRSRGNSIRLVYSSNTSSVTTPTVTTNQISNITYNSAICGGNVISDGGANVTVRGVCWGTSHNPTIANSHTTNGTGIGQYYSSLTGLSSNTTYYVRAYATNSAGTAYGNEISFTTTQQVPTGAINGLFSVSSTQQVWFSQGNLQYRASTNTWRFADNQYDYIGNDNLNLSATYNGWIDLFGWGTSGYNHGAVCYQPWSSSQSSGDYCAYGNYNYNLYDQSGKADWGYNAISNGGNSENLWRTLTREEWIYVCISRNTPSGILYAKAQVNGINGVILLPDNWNSSIYNLNNPNQSTVGYSINIITASQWTAFDNHGAIFLPAAGFRRSNNYYEADHGNYWSSKSNGQYEAYRLVFTSNLMDPNSGGDGRYRGQSVRLVHDAE